MDAQGFDILLTPAESRTKSSHDVCIVELKINGALADRQRVKVLSGSGVERLVKNWARDFGLAHTDLANTIRSRALAADLTIKKESVARFAGSRQVPHIQNVTLDETSKLVIATPIKIMARQITAAKNGWPRRAAGRLFAPGSHNPMTMPSNDAIRYIENDEMLTTWLKEDCSVKFDRSSPQIVDARTGAPCDPVTPGELYHHLKTHALPRYAGVEYMPHHPLVEDLYYVPIHLPPPTGKALATVIDKLNPRRDEDRDLMVAALLTPLWGGPRGSRPAFLFSAEIAGSGKTHTAEFFAQVYGGSFEVRPDANWDTVTSDLLGPASAHCRVILLDNVTGTFGDAEIDKLITKAQFTGHLNYEHHATRPNRMTVYITANTPTFGNDTASRCVKIEMNDPPNQSGGRFQEFDLREWGNNFLADNQMALLSDMLAVLKAPAKCTIQPHARDRFSSWQNAILTRFENGNDLAQLINERRPSINMNIDDSEELLHVIESELEARGHNPATEAVRILKSELAMWAITHRLKKGDSRLVSRWITDIRKQPSLRSRLVEDANKRGGRAWIWYGVEIVAKGNAPVMPLRSRRGSEYLPEPAQEQFQGDAY